MNFQKINKSKSDRNYFIKICHTSILISKSPQIIVKISEIISEKSIVKEKIGD